MAYFLLFHSRGVSIFSYVKENFASNTINFYLREFPKNNFTHI